ncbi:MULTISPECIES: LysR family transcriptional regulator [unclassified Crossiella]|uniref:LysR family transcriptional regulator n=1 Tax=unclassified Crossiella TaxID=2620835 RepID=UPI001FFF5C0D|nr:MULTISPECIES: LysR family transcriptional regulator [unclassified Crossiella]MCK2241539.1 LysR family transcriptional regulator [Crossiella sp. S99.2]MCK2255589.1 LysR family transcriptional regulator [Crossiella sp. S99.1]
MDLRTLTWFREVAEGATVTETARRAHLTQPALSRALARLDQETGAALFQRVGKTLVPTPAGHLFKTCVTEVLDRYAQGLRAVADLTDPGRGTVPLTFLHTLGTWLVPPLLSRFRAGFPDIAFELTQHGEAGLAAALLSGTADLAVTSDDPGHPQLRWQHLLTEPLFLAVPPRHRLARRSRVRLADLAEEPFILLRPGYALRATTEDRCRQAGFTPRVGFEGEEVETLRGLVAAGLGVALLPLPGGEPATPHLRLTDVPATRDIGLMWLADRELPPASAEFREHVLDTVAGGLDVPWQRGKPAR